MTAIAVLGNTPEAIEKRRQTWERRHRLRREDVRRLRKRGLVPLAIADVLGLSDQIVAAHLRDRERSGEIEPLPAFLSLHL